MIKRFGFIRLYQAIFPHLRELHRQSARWKQKQQKKSSIQLGKLNKKEIPTNCINQ